MLNQFRQLNPSLNFFDIFDKSFLQYGRIITEYDFGAALEIMKSKPIPPEGNVHIPSDDNLTSTDLCTNISQLFYGNMPLQAGYCNGRNQKLGALEYHKGSEIDVAVNEFVLLLGDIRNIHNNQFSTLNIKAFYVPKGTACELYGTTLHFSPCQVTDDGFKSIIILPKGTNLPLSYTSVPKCNEDKLLWMQNKWLIAHTDSKQTDLGAHVGIIGENIEVNYK